MTNERTNAQGTKESAPNADPIARQMGEWLGTYPWEAWCTLTFRDGNFSPEAATRAANRWFDWVRSNGSPDVCFFLGHEAGGLTGRHHLHGLIGNLTPYTQRKALWDWWFKRYGRAQVLPYDPAKGACFYVSKYVSKKLDTWDIELDGFRKPMELSLFTDREDAKCLCVDTHKKTRPRRPSGRKMLGTGSPKD